MTARPAPSVQSAPVKASLLERDLARAWAERLYSPGPLHTQDGIPLQVVYPGRPNGDRGPDFLDALLVFGAGPLRRGAVELHLTPDDWRGHGHASDPAYAAVVLHVVAHAGRHIQIAGAPVLELCPFPATEETAKGVHSPSAGSGQALGTPSGAAREGEPERRVPWRSLRGGDGARLLEEMGAARLEAQAAALEGDLAAVGPEQALYEALLSALGYSKNVAPFCELARRVPLALLHDVAQGAPSIQERESRVASLLFGAARLLPSQRGVTAKGVHPSEATPSCDNYTRRAEEAWRWLGGMEPLPEGSWQTFRVRPENHPLRRVGAATALVLRWLERDLIGGLRTAAMACQDPRAAAAMIIEQLQTGAEGYWGLHRDFGVARKGSAAALVGAGRAREIAVNVALPFLLALGDLTGDLALERAARSAYVALPAPPENGLARWAAVRFLSEDDGAVPLTALRQQGLLHLAKGYLP